MDNHFFLCTITEQVHADWQMCHIWHIIFFFIKSESIVCSNKLKSSVKYYYSSVEKAILA